MIYQGVISALEIHIMSYSDCFSFYDDDHEDVDEASNTKEDQRAAVLPVSIAIHNRATS